MILFKMLTRGVISEINGCISTGKEVSIQQSALRTLGSISCVAFEYILCEFHRTFR